MYRVCPGKRLVLASASPRRQELLALIGLSFTVRPVDLDESILAGENASEAARRLAEIKAGARPEPGESVLAADTLVELKGRILGKPEGPAEAARMLGELSGCEHTVVTGFCLKDNSGLHLGLAKSLVRFRRLTPEEIAAYVATGEPLDKAGAYGVQGIGAALVESISGSYSNVVGLPLAAVVELLLARRVVEPTS